MNSNNNTTTPADRELRWLIHKWVLILWAMYYCYLCLHIYSGLETNEVIGCGIITFIFASVVKYHQEIRSLNKAPNQFVALSPLAAVGNVLRFIVYFVLFFNVIIWLLMIPFVLVRFF